MSSFPRIFGLRTLLNGTLRARSMVARMETVPMTIKRHSHDDRPPKPFDNMPFSAPNRYVATAVFSLLFGVGLWAPFGILWYMMAKRTM